MFIWALFFPKTAIEEKINKALQEQKKKTDLFLKRITLAEIVDGVKYWEIRALTSEINQDTGIAVLRGVSGTFFKGDLKTIGFDAPKVFWNMSKKEIKIESPTGYDRKFKFETDALSWSLATKKILTEGNVVFTGQKITIKAKGLEADLALQKMMLKGKPQVHIEHGRGRIKILCENIEIDSVNNNIMAEEDVLATQGEMEIKADKLGYNGDKNIVFGNGNIKFKYKDISAHADEMIYYLNDSCVLLKGSVVAKKQGSQIVGRQLKIDLNNNRMTIEGGTNIVIDEDEITKEV